MMSTFFEALIFISCFCATETADPHEPGFWNDHLAPHSVIYAEVVDFTPSSPNESSRIRLRPLATLTGGFDAALNNDISPSIEIGGLAVIVRNPPPPKAKVIALLREGISTMGEHYYRIPNAHVACFPAYADEDPQSITRGRHPALFEVTGFEDPKVAETIENLRKLCAKHREEAEKNAAVKNEAVKQPVGAVPK